MTPETIERLVKAVERCAAALEVLAEDIKPKKSLADAAIYGSDKVGIAPDPTSFTAPSAPPDHMPSHAATVMGEELSSELKAQESAKKALGAELYQAVWSLEHDITIADPAPIKALGELARRILGGEANFRAACEAVGVKKGEKPTGRQLRKFVLEHLVPAYENPVKAPEEAVDTWA